MSLFNYPLLPDGSGKPEVGELFAPTLRAIQAQHQDEGTWFGAGEGFQGSSFNLLLRKEPFCCDLLRERIEPEEVAVVAGLLRAWLRQRTAAGKTEGWTLFEDADEEERDEPLLSQQSLEELVAFFSICAERGLAIGGSF